ncbi:MAG: hypothetical protein ACM34E_02900, partial [Acidobacteriota bacterium]
MNSHRVSYILLTRAKTRDRQSETFLTRVLLMVLGALLLGSTLASGEVLKITVNDTIQPITDEYIGRALADAQQHHAKALLIELSTP